jgi:hypothetical protein
MKTMSFLVLLLLPIVSAGGELPERPIWLPVGTTHRISNPGVKTQPQRDNDIVAEVYQENDRLTAQTNVLQVIQQPRWFKGGKPPDSVLDVPLTNQGASLSLQIKPSDSPVFLHLVLTLKAEERSVWRELEHRWTNIIPFLFALTADGKPIGPRDTPSWSKFGGVNGMSEMVPIGKSKTWDVLLDARSVTAALNEPRVKNVTIVAAFSEYQHEVPSLFGRGDGGGGIKGDFKGPPIAVRSNEVRLEFDGERLRRRDDR